MNSVYLIFNQDDEPIGAAHELEKASEMCFYNEMGASHYRKFPFYKCKDTIYKVIAGPIPKEYLK